jgi:RNA polymerase sigma-70 factor (TIGR02957 family)
MAAVDELRPLGFSIAYRMVGSVAEAEDLVQEGLIRLHTALEGGEVVESPRAYLATVVTRLSIDHLRSARVRREAYPGDWLPEPLLGDPAPGPLDRAQATESVSMAFLVVLETLSPVERAVFLLHEVFDFSFAEIADIVDRSEAACRQIAVRARRHVEAGRPRFDPSPEHRAELARRFFAALEAGDLDGLVTLLAQDAELHGDGGGKAPALARPLHGADRVAHALVNWARTARRAGVRLEPAAVNGQPGARFVDEQDRTVSVLSLVVDEDGVAVIHSIVNPDKLRHVGPLADLPELARRLRRRRES